MTKIIVNKTSERAQNAVRAFGETLYRDETSYPLQRAQRALSGKTHYCDDDTLRYFKSKVLRAMPSYSQLYFIIQESLPYGSFDAPRQRRNIVFDVFGSVVKGREVAYKYAKAADKEYSALVVWMDSQEAHQLVIDTLRARIARDKRRIAETLRVLGRGK